MGKEGFNDFYQDVDISNRVQNEIDQNVLQFIAEELQNDPFAAISFMPQTSLKVVEWDKIAVIMTYKLSADIWNSYLAGKTDELYTSQRVALDTALLELYGSSFNKDSVDQSSLSKDLQDSIDAYIQSYIWDSRVLTVSDKILIRDVIYGMPYTRLS